LKRLYKSINEKVDVWLNQEPDQLGFDMREVLKVLSDQDEKAVIILIAFTDGKIRSLIFVIIRIKNVDLQVRRTLELLGKMPGNS
jgi:hypothetical protein